MSLGDVGNYLPFLFPNSTGLMAFLSAYFDESERQEGRKPFCVAGVVFSPARYERFVSSWQRNVLKFRDRKFSAFHMTDLVQGREEYEGLTIPDRLIILNAAIDAVKRNANAGIAVQFAQAEFERKAPKGWSDVYGSIYTAACGMCLQSTGYWLTKSHNHMQVLYVLEDGHKFRAQADEFLAAFGRDDEMRTRCHYRKHIFEAKGEPGLGAADLLAWTITRAMALDGGKAPAGLKPFIPPLLRFSRGLGERFKVYPFEGKRLDRYLAESQTQPFKLFRRRGNHPKGLR